MLGGWLSRWLARWLDKHGLGRVADTLDAEAAEHGDVDALHGMAKRALAEGAPERAVGYLLRAVQTQQDRASLHCTLGAAYRQQGNFDEAWDSYQRALQYKPDYVQVLSNLGEWCIAKGQHAQALEWLQRALTLSPGLFEARINKSAVLFETGKRVEAKALAEALVEEDPQRPEALLNLGNVLMHTGKARQAIKCYKKALEIQPGYAEAHFNLATFLGSKVDQIHAISYLERRLKEHGDTLQTLGMLASAYQAAGQLEKSEDFCRRMLQRQPDNLMALITLGSCLSASGDAAGAIALFDRVMEVDPGQAGMGSNRVFEMNNAQGVTRQALFDAHRAWAVQHAEPLHQQDPFAQHDRNPQRRIRIGYVSGDFVQHPVGFLLRDILRHHDAKQFEVYCYSMVLRPEDVLPELRTAADVWEDIFYLSDEEVDALVRKHSIDILIDLSGHTAMHRLMVFARKPAPVQAEWIGYFHSTGMREIDYFITDPYTSPKGSGQLFAETPVHMPHTRFCYGPPDYAPDVQPPPSEKKGYITFGSFNRLAKMTDEVVQLWCAVLNAVPDSRLVIKGGVLSEPVVQERLRARFGDLKDRVELREGTPHHLMLAEYGDIDIALDTFPFNGGMTTLEALWMGVPVITIAGNTVVSRQTVSALANVDLVDGLVFDDVDAYAAGAIALANNPLRLAEIRKELRPRMAASPLRQTEQFTRDLECLYRQMWQAWCRGEKLPSDV